MENFVESKETLTGLQLELLKSLNYMATEKQLKEIRSLLRFYFASQLDASIEKVESEKSYTIAIYEKWLEGKQIQKVIFVPNRLLSFVIA